MTREEPWMELDEELARYFQALAAEVPKAEPRRRREAREHYRAMVRALRPRRRSFWAFWKDGFTLMRPSFRWAFALVLLLAFLFTSGAVIVRASERALPGSPLYTVKLWQENFFLRQARNPRVRAQLHQRFAQRRIHELRDLLASGRQQGSGVLLENLLYHVDALAQIAQGEPGSPPANLAADIQLLASVVDPQHQQALLQTVNALYQGKRLVGILEQRESRVWTIDGTQVVLTPDTLVQGMPRVGDVVEVVGHPLERGRWQAQWIRVAARAEARTPLEISLVGEVQRQGQAWRIDGHEFLLRDPSLAVWLTPGALVEVHLQWDAREEVWKAIKVEPKTSYKGYVREIYGYLEAREPHRVRVNGIWWNLAPEAEIEGVLEVGVYIELEVWQDAQGEWWVLEVEVEDDEEEEEGWESDEPYEDHREDPNEYKEMPFSEEGERFSQGAAGAEVPSSSSDTSFEEEEHADEQDHDGQDDKE